MIREIIQRKSGNNEKTGRLQCNARREVNRTDCGRASAVYLNNSGSQLMEIIHRDYHLEPMCGWAGGKRIAGAGCGCSSME